MTDIPTIDSTVNLQLYFMYRSKARPIGHKSKIVYHPLEVNKVFRVTPMQNLAYPLAPILQHRRNEQPESHVHVRTKEFERQVFTSNGLSPQLGLTAVTISGCSGLSNPNSAALSSSAAYSSSRICFIRSSSSLSALSSSFLSSGLGSIYSRSILCESAAHQPGTLQPSQDFSSYERIITRKPV